MVDPIACRTASPPNSLPASFWFGSKDRARELAVGEDADPKVTSVESMMNPVWLGLRARPIYGISSRVIETRIVQRSRMMGRFRLTLRAAGAISSVGIAGLDASEGG